MKKTVSLCIIAKDAEDTLTNCLRSVSGLVNDIVLIDTGSTDKTKYIAADFDARIFDFKWNDNFSSARNFSLSKIVSDWVLILDSDEILVGTKEQLEMLINQDFGDEIPMYFIDIFTYIKNAEKPEYVYYQKKIRLFPRHSNVFFKNSVYEEMVHPNGTENMLGLSANGIVIKHFLKDGPKSKSKRNALILRKELKKNPGDFLYNYLMGKEYLQYGYYDKALTYYRNSLESEEEKEKLILSEICTDIIKILYRKGDLEEALNECIRREGLCKDNPEYWLNYGFLALKQGDLECAKKSLETCLELTPPAHSITFKISNLTWKPELLLGYIFLRMGDNENAKTSFERALKYNPGNWLLLFYLGIVCKNLKDFNSSEIYFNEASGLVPEEFKKDLQFSFLLVHIMNGKFEKANELVKSMVDAFINPEEMELLDEAF